MNECKISNEQIAHDIALHLSFENNPYDDKNDYCDNYIDHVVQDYFNLYDSALKAVNRING